MITTKKKLMAGLSILAFASTSFVWANTFYCPNTHRYISTGQTLAEVEAACGKPTQTTQSKQPVTETVAVQQWIYKFSPQGVTISDNNLTGMFSVRDGIVYRITLEGEEVNSLSFCEGKVISVGATSSELRSACGRPEYVNQAEQEIPTGEQQTIITWRYDYGPYQPDLTLEFQDGLLTLIRQ